MQTRLLCYAGMAWILCAFSANGQAPQKGAGTSRFIGRWEIQLGTSPRPYAIVEIQSMASGLTGRVIDTQSVTQQPAKISDISAKDDQIVFVLSLGLDIKFKGNWAGDHIEGTAAPEGATEVPWTARITTKNALQSEDQRAFNSAMAKPTVERAAALQQFLKDYPGSSYQEQANYQIAYGNQNPDERIAALRKFLEQFPNGSYKDQANLQIALAPRNTKERMAALQKFIEDFPSSRLKEQAAYQLTTLVDPAERLAAQEKFIKDYPKSPYAGTLYRTLVDSYARDIADNQKKLNQAIDGFLNSGTNKVSAANTIADRLMVNEVSLDRALELIRNALVSMPEKTANSQKAVYFTTLGQVLFKLKEYDQAEIELKRAIEIAGADGDGEALWYLGKILEVRNNPEAAIDSYMKAVLVNASRDIRTDLEAAYRKKYGSLDGLNAKLDSIYRARPKPFDPGHFVRSDSKEPLRVVLAELFTGAECGPCVASDLAFDGLMERYDRSTLAVMVYHLHIPGPDPMTNADTESRSKYYQVRGTPTAVIDGIDPQVGGGGSAQAARVFDNYKAKVEARLPKRPMASFSGLKATLDGQMVTVSGQVELTRDAADRTANAKLRLALVEEEVGYGGSNGVRIHNLVVRKILGSPEGKTLQKPGTRTPFSESVNVADLGGELTAYLARYEKERSEKSGSEFKFHDKPGITAPARLLVVAFVQDDQTKEILQAQIISPGSPSF
jgi:tetratricopeptide (TPR) repeat protein